MALRECAKVCYVFVLGMLLWMQPCLFCVLALTSMSRARGATELCSRVCGCAVPGWVKLTFRGLGFEAVVFHTQPADWCARYCRMMSTIPHRDGVTCLQCLSVVLVVFVNI